MIPYRTLPGVGGGGPEISGLRDFRRFLRAISSKVGPPEAEIFEDLGRCFKQKTRSKCTLERIFSCENTPASPKNFPPAADQKRVFLWIFMGISSGRRRHSKGTNACKPESFYRVYAF